MHDTAPQTRLLLRPGTRDDYAALSPYHYRPTPPATFERVLTLADPAPTPTDRFCRRAPQPRPVAVAVLSRPTLSCRMREAALPQRFGRWLDARERAAVLNAELRCISRVIVHPQWRGLGLAVRLVRALLDDAPTRFTEALAAMGHVHPFFARAGMTAYPRHPHAHDQRLIDALALAGVTPGDLASLDRARAQIDHASSAALVQRELRRWARHVDRAGRHDDPLQLAQQRLALTPVYFLHDRVARRSAPVETGG